MNCDKIKELLSGFIDDQLDKDDRKLVEEHLKSCAECTEHFEKLLALGRMVDDFDIDGDESYWAEQKDAVLDRIEKLETEKVVPVRRSYRNLIYKLAAVAASVALIAFISVHEAEKVGPVRGLFKSEKAKVSQPSESVNYLAPAPVKDADTMTSERVNVSGEMKARDDAAPVMSVPTIETAAGVQVDEGKSKKMERAAGDQASKPAVAEEAVKDQVTEQLESIPAPKEATSSAEKKGTLQSDNETAEKTVTEFQAEMNMPVAIKDRADAEASRMAATEQADMAKKILPVIVPSDSVASLQQLSAGSEADKAPSTDAYMAMYDVEKQATELKERGLDPNQFDDLTGQDIATYINYYDDAQQLRQNYGYVLASRQSDYLSKTMNFNSASTPAKGASPGRPSADSLHIIIRTMADAFHNLGKVTPIKNERGLMLEYLRSLRNQADSGTITEIDKYIGDLEPETK
ncbi:MAG: hypothetical protein CVT49_03690 [candidate division Zixibacteria bacterium HGW-Zixibacteria-1]|nr:MAG: hypothetical protein CVT49_03690 [candidate division Zixibacteria bacterium HGW-Zixibacteria-1]